MLIPVRRSRAADGRPLPTARAAAMLGVAVVSAVVAAVLLLHGDPRSVSDRSPSSATVLAQRAAHAVDRTQESASAGRGIQHSATMNPRWSHVLADLLSRRATAWRQGRPQMLRSVYLPGSVQLAQDVRMLRAYLRRGLRVSGVRTRCMVVTLERQLPNRASLVVVDALGEAVAHDAQGSAQPLPHDLPTRHRIRLVMTAAGWRIAGISLA